MVLQNSIVRKKEEGGPFGEMYPASDDANETMNIKAEEVSDAVEEEDPVAITFPKMEAEPEVSCMCLCMSTVRQILQICSSVSGHSDLSLFVNMKQLHSAVDWI
jgi:hypothetical protein